MHVHVIGILKSLKKIPLSPTVRQDDPLANTKE